MIHRPAQTIREVEEHGLRYRVTWERGEVADVEVIEILTGADAYWRGLGRVVERIPAERDGDAERKAQLEG